MFFLFFSACYSLVFSMLSFVYGFLLDICSYLIYLVFFHLDFLDIYLS